jgi:hypothetical protein
LAVTVDFIWTRGDRAIGIEVKAAASWRGEYGTTIKTPIAEGVLTGGHGVYTGPVELKDGPLRIWPLQRFLEELTVGRVLR